MKSLTRLYIFGSIILVLLLGYQLWQSTAVSVEDLADQDVLTRARQVMDLLKNKDFQSLEAYVHTTKGVRLSPYAYVDAQNDQTIKKEALISTFESDQKLIFGSYDGSGEPIDLSFAEYYDKFIYSADFVNPHQIGINHAIGQGNTINNIHEMYPEGTFVEFHFTGFDPQFEGLDWKSLILVFELEDEEWRLVAIVNSMWTI